MNKIILLFMLIYSVFSENADAQSVDTTRTVEHLVKNVFIGQGVIVGNITFKGEKHAIGYYQDTTDQLNIRQGILLTSGNAFFALGPNKSPRTGWASNAPGDDELDGIARGKTYDASVLEFDFVTRSENMSFEFVFASEEYLEYVGSKFNDVFAFYIVSPEGTRKNIALLPDDKTPITINTVNNKLNAQYYVDNSYTNVTDPFIWNVRDRKVVENKNYQKEEVPPKFNIQFDGFTTVLVAKATVMPNTKYRIKIAIADVGDGILDSGVILKGKSFSSHGRQMVSLDNNFFEQQPELVERKVFKIKSKPRSKAIRATLGNIEFDFDKYVITSNAKATIQKALDQWTYQPTRKIYLTGHTDDWGSNNYNMKLSEYRSRAVANELVRLGVPTQQIIITYYGENKPLQSNHTSSGRARNRRVELSIGE